MYVECWQTATFYTNPQYHISVVDPDSDDEDGNGSVMVGLMQKDRRKMRREGKNELAIGYAVYEVRWFKFNVCYQSVRKGVWRVEVSYCFNNLPKIEGVWDRRLTRVKKTLESLFVM